MKKLLLYLLHSAYLALTAAPIVLYAAASAGAPAWPAMLLLCGASFAGNAVSCFLRERRALFALLAAGLAAVGAALLPLFPWSLLLAAMNLVVALTGARRIVAFGDNGNDEGLFAGADLRVAVRNATPGILALADRVIGENTQDAVVRCIAEMEGLDPERL